MTDVDELPAMWYCPRCETWVGTKLGECVREGHPRPRWPLLADDVDVNEAWRVTWRDRVRAKVRRIRGR